MGRNLRALNALYSISLSPRSFIDLLRLFSKLLHANEFWQWYVMFCQALCDSICKNLIWLPSSLYPIWNDNLWQFTDQEDTKLHLHGSNIPKTMTAVHLTTIVCKLEIRVRNNSSPVYCSSGYNYITHKYGNSFQILILVRFLLKKGGANEGGGEGEGRRGEEREGEGKETKDSSFHCAPSPSLHAFIFTLAPWSYFSGSGKICNRKTQFGWHSVACGGG